MKQASLSNFPVSEYEHRVSRLVAEMGIRGIDAAIFTSDETTYYFSGFNSIVWDSKVSTPGILVITRDGDMSISTTKGGMETARVTSCVEDIRYYTRSGEGYGTYAKAATSLLAEKGLLNGRIGMEFGTGLKMHLNHLDREALFAELSRAELVNVADAVWPVRSIKSSHEIELLRKSCEINHRGIEKGLSSVREGTTELELYRTIVQEYFRLGAERSLVLGVRAGPERYSQANCPPSERPIGKGEFVLVDGGPFYKGYCSDIIRLAMIGHPTAEQQEMYDIARDAVYAGLEEVKPGTPIRNAVQVVDNVMTKVDRYAPYYVNPGKSGHSIGVGVHEYPMIELDTDRVFEPGMVFAIEPYFYKEAVGSIGIEENVLVTDQGCEILTPSDSRLMILQS